MALPSPGRLGPLELISAALVLCGLGVAGYLTYTHYAELSPVCVAGGSGCEVVQSSDYAEIAGVPVALIGLIGYALVGAALAIGGQFGLSVTLGLTLGGTAFSAYLTYLEIWVIDAICQWCVASAIIMTMLFVVSAIRFLRVP